jgi:hypothetical protein
MSKIFSLVLLFSCMKLAAQVRVDKATLQNTYSYTEIHPSLRAVVDEAGKSEYFNDEFFNAKLKKIISSRAFTEKEKVQMFFLMQKKIGFAFFGVEYLPPKQNYFEYHSGKIYTYQKTKLALKDLNYDVLSMLRLVDSNITRDPIVASNALLLAALLNSDSTVSRVAYWSDANRILASGNPGIFNHYVCLSASILQNAQVAAHLSDNMSLFKDCGMIEDAICALYSKNNPVSEIRKYLLMEKNPTNALAVQTAICVITMKLPSASSQLNIKTLITDVQEKWKADILRDELNNKIPYHYKLASANLLVTKNWKGATVKQFADGILVNYGAVQEFDPN